MDLGRFLTGFLVVMGIALPAVLVQEDSIADRKVPLRCFVLVD